jgi:hypothetical protein
MTKTPALLQLVGFLVIFAVVFAGVTLFAEDALWTPPVSLDDLPVVEQLPDVMRFADGRMVSSPDDWIARRKQIKAMVQYYEYGHLPPRPDSVTVDDFKSLAIPNTAGIEERMTLMIDSEHQLRMRIAVYRPKSGSRFPVIVREEHALGAYRRGTTDCWAWLHVR